VRGQLAIGAIQNVGPVNIPALLARYHHRHPAVALRLHHASVPSLVHRTADGQLELAIVDLPLGPQANRVKANPIGREALLLGVAANDPLAHRTRARLVDLGDRAFVEYRPDSSLRASIDQAFQSAGLKRGIVCEVDAMPDLVELVALGVGVALLPPRALKLAGDRAVGLTTDPSITRDLLLVTPRDREPSPAAAAFLELFDH
jgi:DNA-binding transcriptional LysR family regulator